MEKLTKVELRAVIADATGRLAQGSLKREELVKVVQRPVVWEQLSGLGQHGTDGDESGATPALPEPPLRPPGLPDTRGKLIQEKTAHFHITSPARRGILLGRRAYSA